jgi:hypothetical protein
MNLKVDFFALDYQQEQPRSSSTFGINDGVQQDGKEGMAYTTTDGTASSWNAVVENKGKYEVAFTPLDHNVIVHPVPSETYSLCDGMLHRAQVWLAFVELKVQKGDWIQHNIEQLESTIKLFCENHDYMEFQHHEAYAANRKHPSYHFSHKVQMNEFHSRTKFRLLIQNTIQVK